LGEQLLIMFVVVAGAAVVPIAARMMHIPSAVLEIVYGILVFNILIFRRPEWFFLLKELGLIYLMFIAGMELNLSTITKRYRLFWYILIPVLSLLSMPLVFHFMGYPFYLGIAISMISAGIVIPVLKESGFIKTDLGNDIIGIALAGELISILFLTAIDIYHKYGLTLMAGLQGVKLLLLMLLAAFFIRILYIVAWWNPEKVTMVMESEDPIEEGMRGVILVLFAGAVLTYSSGIEPFLGSFIAGVIFAHVFKSKGRFEDKINAVGFGFFVPFFFIGVGANLNIGLFSSFQNIALSLFLTFMLFLSNIFPLIFSFFMKIKKLEALSICFILSAPLSLLVVAGTIGERTLLISAEMKDSLILTALFSSVLFPFFFRLVGKRIMAHENPPS
jgi:Kef-type K+ transport system membrane component KefB